MSTVKNISFSYQEFESLAELVTEDQELIAAAKRGS